VSINGTWLDIHLLTGIGGDNIYNVTSTNLNELYWTPYQQATHLTSAGEGLSTGDIFGTGTISSAVRGSASRLVYFHTDVLFDDVQRTDSNGEKTGLACLVERSLPRTSLSSLRENKIMFLEDGDELVMEGWCVNKINGVRFGFGQCRGTVTPAVNLGH
jgi:fumarylacetoacetase